MTSRTPTSFRCPQLFFVFGLLLLCAGWACNLAIDVEAHPYDADAGSVPDTELRDTTQSDTPPEPVIGPRPIITELMVKPSDHPSSEDKIGQYIEIHNIGDQAIHPTDLVIAIAETNDRIYVDQQLISSPEEQAVVDGLVDIEPGDYFVFLRREDPVYEITKELDDGTYYEYGRYNRPITLSTSTQTLRLNEIHKNFQFTTHHEVGWREGWLVDLDEVSESRKEIRTDIGLGLEPDVDGDHAIGDPSNWCYHVIRFGDGPLLGSPGRPSPQSCL